MKLDPHHPEYPSSLFRLDEPPTIHVSGRLQKDMRRIAIVGSRSPRDGAAGFAATIAYFLAREGIIVVSGGAVGVDRAAHEGALRANGTTWLVSPTGRGVVYPESNRDLVEQIENSETSRVIWPFSDGTRLDKTTPRLRNGVLVGLAEAVIVVQAALRSGSRNAVRWAREIGVKLFVPPGPPWDPAFWGSMVEIRKGASAVSSMAELLNQLGVPFDRKKEEELFEMVRDYSPQFAETVPSAVRSQTYSDPPIFPVDKDTWTDAEKLVYSTLSMAPTQRDKIIEQAGVGTSSTITALLTLSLKDVVVEGPDGFFRTRGAL